MPTTTLSVNNLRFTVDVSGPSDGAPVLLLHGFPQCRVAWQQQLPALGAAGFRCYAPDQRGYSSGAWRVRERRRSVAFVDQRKTA